MKHTTPRLSQLFSEPPRLPTLPIGIHRFLALIADDDLNYSQLAIILIDYPVIAARLLSLANSAWAAPMTPITDIENACARLGLSVVKSISIALAVSSPFDPRRCPGFDLERFWSTSILVAEGADLLVSSMLRNQLPAEFQKTAQTAGLLHNLGLLWLADTMPNETGKALTDSAADPSCAVYQLLRQYTGTDYGEIGGWLLNGWDIPDVVVIAINHHFDHTYQGQSWEISLLVGSAAAMVAALHRAIDQSPENTNLEYFGIDRAAQQRVFEKLQKKLERTRELAQTFFV